MPLQVNMTKLLRFAFLSLGILVYTGCSKVSYYDLERAVKATNTNVVAEFVRVHGDINAEISVPHHHHGKTTLLHIACDEGNTRFVSALLDFGASVNATDSKGKTPLFEVIGAGDDAAHREVLELLLERGADLAHKDREGWTPLMRASHVGEAVYVDLLLKAGADPKWSDENGNTPLHMASSAEVVKLLVQAGADINVTNSSGQTPLDVERLLGGESAAVGLRRYGGTNNF